VLIGESRKANWGPIQDYEIFIDLQQWKKGGDTHHRICFLLTFTRGLGLYVRSVLRHLDLRVQPGNLTGARLAEGQRREQAVTQPHLVKQKYGELCKVMIHFRQC
jgi:hypothetical protein